MVELLNLIQSLTISKKLKYSVQMVNYNYAQHEPNSSWCIDLLYITFFYFEAYFKSLNPLVLLIYNSSLSLCFCAHTRTFLPF